MNIRRLGEGRARGLRRKPAVEGLEERSLLSITLSNPGGPLTSLTVGGDGSFQVHRAGFIQGQVYYPSDGPADAGIFLRQADGIVDGLNPMAGNSAADSSHSRPLHSISQVESPDGQSVVTVADNSTDGTARHFQLTQVTTYHPGNEYFRVDNTILNQGTAPLTLDVFAAADTYLADTDKAVGFLNASAGAVGGVDKTGQYHAFIQPTGNLAPSAFQEDHFNNLWTVIGTPGAHFNNTALLPSSPTAPYNNDANYVDNGAGLEWKALTIEPGQSASVSYYWSFGAETSVVENTNPLSASGVVIQTTEGSPVSGSVASFTTTAGGATADTFSASINWGDGTTSAGTIAADGEGGFTVSGGHTYGEPGAYPLAVTILDNASHSVVANGSVTVADAPLIATATAISAQPGIVFSGTVASFSDADPDAAASKYSATIAWGDGTTSAGTISANGASGFLVGGSHTYAQPPGSSSPVVMPTTVVIHDSGGSSATVHGTSTLTFTKSIPDPPPATPPPTTPPPSTPTPTGSAVTVGGALDSASDSGASSSDGITNNNRPTFRGQATPGTVVTLVAQGTGSPVSLGSATVGADGRWSISPGMPLADGSYTITATAAATGGPSASATLSTLEIDTVGPRVAALSFNAGSGKVSALLQDDRSGIDLSSATDTHNYLFQRMNARRVQPFAISSVSAVSVAGVNDTQPVTVTIHGGAAVGHGRRFIFTATSGIRDKAGNALDGTFSGAFPSGGDGHPASFQARLVSAGRHAFAPLPLNLPFSDLTAPKKVAHKK